MPLTYQHAWLAVLQQHWTTRLSSVSTCRQGSLSPGTLQRHARLCLMSGFPRALVKANQLRRPQVRSGAACCSQDQ